MQSKPRRENRKGMRSQALKTIAVGELTMSTY